MKSKGRGIHAYDVTFIEDEFYDPYGDDGRCWGDLYDCYDDEEEEEEK